MSLREAQVRIDLARENEFSSKDILYAVDALIRYLEKRDE